MNAAGAAGNDHELEIIEPAAVGGGVGGGVGNFILNDSREIMKDILSMLFGDIFGDGKVINLGIEVYTNNDDDSVNDEEVDDSDAETMDRAFRHLSRPATEGGPRIFVGRIKNERTVQKTPILRLVSRNVETGYHSSMGEMDGAPMIDINYSLRGDKFLRGETREAVRFKYNVATDRAIYLLSCQTRDFHFYIASLNAHAVPPSAQITPLHPFCVHLILLFKLVLSRGAHLEKLIRTLIAEEEGRGAQQGAHGGGGDGGGGGERGGVFGTNNNNNNNEEDQSDLDSAETERHLRRLHGIFQEWTVGENVNRREMATVECLLRDLRRLRGYASKWRRQRKLSSSSKEMMMTAKAESSPLPPVQQQQQQLQMFDWLAESDDDNDSNNHDNDKDDSSGSNSLSFHGQAHHHHQRLVDSFLCLRDFCSNRAIRINTRKQRTTNLINLTYNLLANRNSLSSHRTAVESAAIAHEARRDTVAMRTIAVLTMLFLPPAFISGLLGTNLIVLETPGAGVGGAGGSRIVVSELWWIYFVLAVPLTLATLGVWWLVLRRSKKRRRLGRRGGWLDYDGV